MYQSTFFGISFRVATEIEDPGALLRSLTISNDSIGSWERADVPHCFSTDGVLVVQKLPLLYWLKLQTC